MKTPSDVTAFTAIGHLDSFLETLASVGDEKARMEFINEHLGPRLTPERLTGLFEFLAALGYHIEYEPPGTVLTTHAQLIREAEHDFRKRHDVPEQDPPALQDFHARMRRDPSAQRLARRAAEDD